MQKWEEVSIQLLFRWNNFIAYLVRSRLIGFNTTIVSVEPMIVFCAFEQMQSFNTTIVSVERDFKRTLKRGLLVSIQLLFRWNLNIYYFIYREFLFQYNYCFGGTQ